MSQFIESICCLDGELQLIELHQARVNRTFFTNYGLLVKPVKLAKRIKGIPSKGKFKCRVVYDKDEFEYRIEPYQKRSIKSVQVVVDEKIDYRFKYADRRALDELYKFRNEADDVIIVKGGQITDSYYANLVFFDGDQWWTSDHPLLAGVKRQSLIDQRLIQIAELTLGDLPKFEKVSLINAMLDLGDVELPIEAVKI